MPRTFNRDLCRLFTDRRFTIKQVGAMLGFPQLIGFTVEFDGSLTVLLPQPANEGDYPHRTILFEQPDGKMGWYSIRTRTEVLPEIDCTCDQCLAQKP